MLVQKQISAILFTTGVIATNSLFSILGIQNPAAALVENQASISSKQLTVKQPTQVAINDVYWGPNQDFRIRMPGKVQSNKKRTLTSFSKATQTVYVILHQDLPPETDYLSNEKIREVLQTSMRKKIDRDGKIIRSTNYVIEGYPGLQLLVQQDNGYVSQYRAFVVKRRMYIIGAVTKGELGKQSERFFDSFRVYPQRLF